MKVSEAIDRLEVGETVWVKATVDRINNEGKYIRAMSNASSVYLDGRDEISLTEPQAEKVEVPSCMGTFLDRYPDKKETAMHIIMHDFTESKYFDEFVKFPLTDYPMGWDRLMASALMFGYTVKPKRWVVKAGDYHSTYVDSLTITSEKSRHTISGKEKAHYFTDRAKAEAVATLVEGSVEEV